MKVSIAAGASAIGYLELALSPFPSNQPPFSSALISTDEKNNIRAKYYYAFPILSWASKST